MQTEKDIEDFILGMLKGRKLLCRDTRKKNDDWSESDANSSLAEVVHTIQAGLNRKLEYKLSANKIKVWHWLYQDTYGTWQVSSKRYPDIPTHLRGLPCYKLLQTETEVDE